MPDSGVLDPIAGAERALRDDGWTTLPAVLPREFVAKLAGRLDEVYVEQRQLQVRNGVGKGTDGTVHHLPCAGGEFLELLEREHGQEVLARFFQGPYILNTYGGILNRRTDAAYVGRVHRDLRTHSAGLHLMVQLLVMVDEFTEENGATYLWSGSHRLAERPEDDLFFRNASRAVGSAGTIVIFDSNLWHAAGANRTNRPRRALTLAFTRPFIKQQLDYPRALGYERAPSLSPTLRQLLGFNARVPVTLDDWFQPPEQRLYRRDQG